MKTLAQLKKLAVFAKEHGVTEIEFSVNGDVTKLKFDHPPEPLPELEPFFEKNKSNEEDDLFYSVNVKPKK